MADPENVPDPSPSDKTVNPDTRISPTPADERAALFEASQVPPQVEYFPADISRATFSHQRRFRRKLLLFLSLALAAFILTSWILVRLDTPLGVDSSEPQEIVRAHLRALDRGELRPAYEMFSARYRRQVSYDAWHELVASHWRMFHAAVVRAEAPAPSGTGVTLQIYLHGADHKDYRARFSLIRTDGRWWIDDVHWTEEQDARDLSRT